MANLELAPARKTRSPAILAWLHLMRVVAQIDRKVEQQLRTIGLTHPQFGVLARLRAGDGLTQQELGETLLLDKGNLCGILDRLEEQGLVERDRDPQDRRCKRIRLTDRGHRLLEQATPALDTLLERLFLPLTRAEQNRLRILLHRLEHKGFSE